MEGLRGNMSPKYRAFIVSDYEYRLEKFIQKFINCFMSTELNPLLMVLNERKNVYVVNHDKTWIKLT